MFSEKGSQFSKFGILRLITAFEKKLVPFHLPLHLLLRCHLIQQVLFFQKTVPYLTRKAQQFSKNISFQLCAFHLDL